MAFHPIYGGAETRKSGKTTGGIIIAVLSLFTWTGCNVINPGEVTPTYIHIDSFKFNSYLPGASITHKITSISVYYNNSPVGFFDLPATIPIIAVGKGDLEIAPAIAMNGLSNQTTVYPFYRIDTSSFTAQPGKIINYTPQTGYYAGTKMQPKWDFSGNTGFSRWGGNRDILTVTDDSLVFSGGTGSILMISPGDSSVDSTITEFVIPSGSAFIEFDYKSSVPFFVGLQANLSMQISSTPHYMAGINPSDQWRKFYLNVSDFNRQALGKSYNFYLKTVLPDGQAYGRLLIDNIQLVTF